MDNNPQEKYVKLCKRISNASLQDVQTFVEKEGVTSEEYYSLWESASDEDFEFRYSYPLCAAALRNDADKLQFLISLGFDPDGAHLGTGERPIHSACDNSLFLEEDEDQDEGDCSDGVQDSVLEDNVNSERENFEVVRMLVEDHKVDINVANKNNLGMTPLLTACSYGQVKVAKLLVDAGADLEARESNKDYSALHLAARSGSAELCEYLLSEGMYVNETERNDRCPLHYAAFFDNVKAAEVLLDEGADVNMLDNWGCSPCGSGFQTGDLNLIRLLYSRGADPDQEREGRDFLHEAIEFHNYDIARYLVVEMGVPLQTRDYHQNTPFAFAMKRGKMNIAKLLVSCGCDIYNEPCIFDTTLDRNYPEWKSFVSSLKQMAESPRNLQDICCFKIRAIIGRDVVKSVGALAVPNSIKNLLLLSHV